jgi:hypothetical protein
MLGIALRVSSQLSSSVKTTFQIQFTLSTCFCSLRSPSLRWGWCGSSSLPVSDIVSVRGTFESLMRQNARIFSSESHAARMRPIAKWPHSQKNSVAMLQNSVAMPHAAYPHTAYGNYGVCHVSTPSIQCPFVFLVLSAFMLARLQLLHTNCHSHTWAQLYQRWKKTVWAMHGRQVGQIFIG